MTRATTTTLGWVIVLSTCVLVVAALAGQSQDRDKRLLLLTHASLYQHPSLGPAERAVTEWGKDAGFEVTGLRGYAQESDNLDLSMITAEYLDQFDGIMMFTNGNLPMDESQRRALTDFVRKGGGFIGAHSASLTFYDYPEFGEMLGGYFRRAVRQNHLVVLEVEDQEHPATKMLGPSWPVVEDQEHPATKMLGPSWPVVDEFYLFGGGTWDAARPDENRDELFGNPIPMAFSRGRVRVLLSVDTSRTDLSELEDIPIEPGGDYPQAWCRTYGEGRSFYTSLGHTERIWTSDPVFRAHLTGGIRWALGLESGDAQPLGDRRP